MATKAKQGADTMLGRRHAKLKERYEELEAKFSQASLAVLNLRQMFEGAVQEKQVLRQQLEHSNRLIIALVSQARGKSITLSKKTLDSLDRFAGVDTSAKDGALTLTALTVEDVQAMQDDIDEMIGE